MKDYREFREAARRGVEAAGAIPILVEDQPARLDSPRNACLDLVASCDALVLIIGPRGGYVAPSGKLVVEEEFEEAVRRGLSSLVFIQETKSDSAAEELAARLSDFVRGRFRLTFVNPDDLERQVKESLEPLIMQKPQQDSRIIQAALEERLDHHSGNREACLRLAFAPAVADEVIDPLDFDLKDFQNRLLALAHDCGVFSYDFAKSRQTTSDRLIFKQLDDGGRFRGFSSIALSSSGLIVLTSAVTGQKEDQPWRGGEFLSASFEILEGDLRDTAVAMFAFMDKVLEQIDPHRRYETWLYSASLINAGTRKIVEKAARASHASSGWGEAPLIAAYDQPRRITRPVLSHPNDEVHRIVTLLRKRLSEASRPF